MDDLGGRGDVRLGVRDELAGRCCAEEGQGQLPIQVRQLGPERSLHPEARHAGEIPSDDDSPGADHPDRQDCSRPPGDRAPSDPVGEGRLQDVVGDPPQDDRGAHGRPGVDGRAQHRDRKGDRVRGDV